MAENKIHLPSSGGGLLKYSETIKSKIMLTPMTVVILIVIITVIDVILYKIF